MSNHNQKVILQDCKIDEGEPDLFWVGFSHGLLDEDRTSRAFVIITEFSVLCFSIIMLILKFNLINLLMYFTVALILIVFDLYFELQCYKKKPKWRLKIISFTYESVRVIMNYYIFGLYGYAGWLSWLSNVLSVVSLTKIVKMTNINTTASIFSKVLRFCLFVIILRRLSVMNTSKFKVDFITQSITPGNCVHQLFNENLKLCDTTNCDGWIKISYNDDENHIEFTKNSTLNFNEALLAPVSYTTETSLTPFDLFNIEFLYSSKKERFLSLTSPSYMLYVVKGKDIGCSKLFTQTYRTVYQAAAYLETRQGYLKTDQIYRVLDSLCKGKVKGFNKRELCFILSLSVTLLEMMSLRSINLVKNLKGVIRTAKSTLKYDVVILRSDKNAVEHFCKEVRLEVFKVDYLKNPEVLPKFNPDPPEFAEMEKTRVCRSVVQSILSKKDIYYLNPNYFNKRVKVKGFKEFDTLTKDEIYSRSKEAYYMLSVLDGTVTNCHISNQKLASFFKRKKLGKPTKDVLKNVESKIVDGVSIKKFKKVDVKEQSKKAKPGKQRKTQAAAKKAPYLVERVVESTYMAFNYRKVIPVYGTRMIRKEDPVRKDRFLGRSGGKLTLAERNETNLMFEEDMYYEKYKMWDLNKEFTCAKTFYRIKNCYQFF